MPDYTGDQIFEFDGVTGQFMRVVMPSGNGVFPHGIRFGPDGTFYTTSLGESEVHRFAADGTPLGVFIDGTGLFSGASDIVIVPSGCGAPVVVPDGRAGTSPMTADRTTPAGDEIEVRWDVTSCAASSYHLLHGPLQAVATYTLGGAVCGLDPGGISSWTTAPGASTWFLVVGDDGTGTEGGWGADSVGNDRAGNLASGFCGNTQRANGGSCR